MTCIVGVEHDGSVYVGGDRSAVDGWNNFVSTESKIFRKGEILIGMSGSHLLSQVLRYDLELSRAQRRTEEDIAYLVTVFAKEVRSLFFDLASKRDNDGEAVFCGGALFGYRGKLYQLSSNYQINRFTRPYGAIGGGAPFALGAMQVMVGGKPEFRIRTALEAAAELCCDVSEPFDVEVLTERDIAEFKQVFTDEISKKPAPPLPTPSANSPSFIEL